MNAELIRKLKLHMPWRDDKEEQWLHDMARQGWHLVGVNALSVYTFAKGAPMDVDYRLDFATSACKDPSYYQLFADAGWERVAKLSGWQYWRKTRIDGQSREIFSDNASKIAKYKRIQTLLALCSAPMLFNLFNPGVHRVIGRGQSASLLMLGLIFSLLGVMIYAVVRLGLRIRALRQPVA